MYDIFIKMGNVYMAVRMEIAMINNATILDIDMLYYTFTDFINRRDKIKNKLATKDNRYYCIYHLYVEARPWMKDYYRNCIWDYLNGYMTDSELLVEYDRYLSKYGDANE